MCGHDEVAVGEVSSWVATARRLAADGELTAAVAAYEQALRRLDRQGGVDNSWEATVLGDFRVSAGGRAVDLGGLRPQHRALLQVFVSRPDRVLADHRLCDWFWPDADREPARHRLAVGVSAVRSLLAATGGPSLRREIDGYRLDLRRTATDAGRFEQLLADARAARRDQRVARLETAFAAYRGPLLPVVGDADWVLDERERLQAAAVAVAAELADAHARAGRSRDVVRVARAGLRLDRHHDRLWRRLVAALTDLAEPAAAATARREYADVLVDLGVVAWPVEQRRLHTA